ncbi:hypothetical protein [Achromobacter xylosoxidans]|uniref:Uncharacterized protein n=1 Tax=Alcaligenes xylosoxydans xylosoxydans TaxID=85698 RepID=A0A1R1JNI0_ALCXX|nr:hypothetical protein [Achromobacter xylosoxidans]OMG80704.1 hypothetical protein BIZ92_12495 [Achromobacter xylosoxidans]
MEKAAVILNSLASFIFSIGAMIVTASAIKNGEDGLAAIALAVLALKYRLDADLPGIKKTPLQREE